MATTRTASRSRPAPRWPHVGRGGDDATNLHFGRDYPVLANPMGAPRFIGDGAFLFDPRGDLRGYQTYPCELAAC